MKNILRMREIKKNSIQIPCGADQYLPRHRQRKPCADRKVGTRFFYLDSFSQVSNSF